MVMQSYPVPDIRLPLANPKVPSDSLINLMSGELIHPGIHDLLKKISFTNTDHIQYYPSIENALSELSEILSVPVSRMTLSGGADLMISIILQSLGQQTGNLILQHPSYPVWGNFATLNNMKISLFNYGQTRPYVFCVHDLINKMESSQPSLVVIINPHSPTGFCFSPQEIIELSSVCEKYGHLLLIDECFSDFSGSFNYEPAEMNDHVIRIKSFSKSFGIAGARIALTTASEKITRLFTCWRPEATVSGFSLHILQHMLANKDSIARIRKDIVLAREQFVQELKLIKPDWQALPSSANFVVIHLGQHDHPVLVTKQLLQQGYRIRNISCMKGLEGCIRITIADWEIMCNLLQVIKKLDKDD